MRVVQISDTHFAAATGAPPSWTAFVAWLRADPPDLVVHTGDVVLADPDDDADRAAARQLLDEVEEVPVPVVLIPGNHDVGFYDEPDQLPRRLDAFRASWGSDRFVRDLGAWRLVGADAYLLGHDSDLGREHDAWLAASVATPRPTLVFVHQPPLDDRADGWHMPTQAAKAFADALAGTDVALVASGHRHCAARRTVAGQATVWAPSLTLRDHENASWLRDRGARDVDPGTGALDHRLHADGRLEVVHVAF